jgi:hypothetical protein
VLFLPNFFIAAGTKIIYLQGKQQYTCPDSEKEQQFSCDFIGKVKERQFSIATPNLLLSVSVPLGFRSKRLIL